MPGNLWAPERARQWTTVFHKHSTVFHKRSTVLLLYFPSILHYFSSILLYIYCISQAFYCISTVFHYSRLSVALIVTDLNLVCISLYYIITLLPEYNIGVIQYSVCHAALILNGTYYLIIHSLNLGWSI